MIRDAQVTTSANAVNFQALVKRYGEGDRGATVLEDVSSSIAGGSFVSIIGRSGSGKSTLLRLLAGLLKADDGDITLGVESGGVASVRYVFQNYGESLFPWATVERNVAFGLRHATHGQRARRTDLGPRHYLNLVGLDDFRHRYPWELSGGMQQRLAIARALASSPAIVLMDEPFGAVDALSRAKLQDMILDLWGELGITVILVTHDIEEAIYLSDRVLVLHPEGKGFVADLGIDLPRPRSQLHTRENSSFSRYRKELYDLVLL